MPGFKESMAVLALVGFLGAALLLVWEPGGRRVAPRVDAGVAAPVLPSAGPGPMAAAGPGVAPSFDVVRVSPLGSAVIAGRAAAGSEVVVLDGDRVLARVTADRRGEFVALPAEPLAAGGRELTLSAREPRGGAAVRGEQSVVVMVPAVPRGGVAPAETPMVALLDAHGGGTRVLQDGGKRAGALSLDVVDYDEAGAVRFSGRAAAGTAVRVYVDNGAVGDARADETGRWGLAPTRPIAAGVHSLRADAVDGGGKVVSRVELPFQRAAVASVATAGLAGAGAARLGVAGADGAVAGAVPGGRVVVQPGENLWRLARSAYGSGTRYTVIFQANQGQIRDPHLIYPGQAFSVPESR